MTPSEFRPRCSWLVVLLTTIVCTLFLECSNLGAAELVLTLKKPQRVRFVGAFNRWDADGNHRRKVDPKAKIDKPFVDAQAQKLDGNRWKFSGLAAGRYDLVLVTDDRRRIEGFHYPPVLEFDAAYKHGREVSKANRQRIVTDIAKGKHYENKVTPLFLSGNKKQVRVLMQLLRDKPTSFDAQFGQPVATLRHEVWQYTNRYGVWSKEKRTKVLDRVLMGKAELRRWTWMWDPRLGGVDITSQAMKLDYEVPQSPYAGSVRGLPAVKPN